MQRQVPVPPTAPIAPSPYIVNVGDLPRTANDVQALRIRITDLRDQLQDAASRRQTIMRQLPGADLAARPGIEARMGELDSRILRIEKDISQASYQLSNAPALALTGARGWPGAFPERLARDLVPIVGILTLFVLAPFAIAMSRLIWKRASVTPSRPAIDQATSQRLEQLQQSVDTIAIEVERISEGQRFVTRLLSDRPSLGAGAAEPIRAGMRSAVPSERG